MNKIAKSLGLRPSTNLRTRIVLYVFIFILALMPVHTFLTTWTSTITGSDNELKAIKEVILSVGVVAAAWLLIKTPKLRQQIFSQRINQVIIVYGLWHLLVWAIKRPELDAAIIGLFFNLRWLAFFVLAQILAKSIDLVRLRRLVLRILMVGAALVSFFALLQVTALPVDILSHFGYGPDTVSPYITVDQNPDFVRINSFLRGPNPLAAYLMFTGLVSIAVWFLSKKSRKFLYALWPMMLVGLYGSYSRSGLLAFSFGLALAALLYFWSKPQFRRRAIITVIGGAILLPVIAYSLRNTDIYKIVILHDDPQTTALRTSNSERLNSYQKAIEDISNNPLGDGPGTAGPASTYNSDFTSRFSENYYLQIGQETGIVGLVLLVTIIGLMIVALWVLPRSPVEIALLGSFFGYLLINLFLHGWADDTNAYLWWGLAGLYVGASD